MNKSDYKSSKESRKGVIKKFQSSFGVITPPPFLNVPDRFWWETRPPEKIGWGAIPFPKPSNESFPSLRHPLPIRPPFPFLPESTEKSVKSLKKRPISGKFQKIPKKSDIF